MIFRVDINSDCKQCLYYQNQQGWAQLTKHKTRLSIYEREELLKNMECDPSKDSIYLYRIKYPDGSYSVAYTINKPIGKLSCRKCA